MQRQVLERVTAIVAAQARRDPAALSESMLLADLGLDSLGLVEVIFALEEAYDIQIPFSPESKFDRLTLGEVALQVAGLAAQRV
jgi:acyl carrier protein